MKKFKVQKKTFLSLLLIWVVVTSMNITKAVHIDDAAYLEISQHIMQQPLRPMSGVLNWGKTAAPIHQTNNPLLIPYIYAATMSIFGESEIALHAVMSLFSLAAMVFFYLLARRLADGNAILLTSVYCLGPAFIPSQNLMLDVPVTAFWLAFFWMILRVKPKQCGPMYHVLAGVICGIACLTKYVSLVLIPILLLDIALRRKWNRIWVAGIPILFLAGWSLMNYLDYGGFHLLSREIPAFAPFQIGKWCAEWILYLGAISPFSLWLLPYWTAKKRGPVYLGACALLSTAIVLVSLFHPEGSLLPALLRGLFLGSGALVVFTVLHLLFWTLRDRIRNSDSEETAFYACLLAWVFGAALFIVLFAPFVAVRHLLMVVPAILLVFGRFVLPELKKPWIYGGLVATISLGILLGISDWEYADTYRSSAQTISAELGKKSTVWYRGHWGWQWYAKKAGMKQYDMANTTFKKGDYLVVPLGVSKQALRKTQEPQIKRVRVFSKPADWSTLFRTMTIDADTYGGFYNCNFFYRLPWTIKSEEDTVIVERAIADREAVGWIALEGLYGEVGPFPEWNLPVVRWGGGARTRLLFEGDGGRLMLAMSCGKNHLEWQEITIWLNGEQVDRYRFDAQDEFKEIRLPLSTHNGHNVLRIEYQNQDATDPDAPLALLFKQIQILPPELADSGNTTSKGW